MKLSLGSCPRLHGIYMEWRVLPSSPRLSHVSLYQRLARTGDKKPARVHLKTG